METLGGNGSPRPVRPCRRGKVHRQGDSASHASATASGQAWTRAGRRRRSCALESPGATHRSLAQRACEGTHGHEWHSHLQHASIFLQPALAICARPARDVELVEELTEEPVAIHGRKATGGAANMHAGGQMEHAASRTRARAWKDWASTTAMGQAGGAQGGRVGRCIWVGSPAARTS